jgi:O-antigen/teichoic acid export membrane protein
MRGMLASRSTALAARMTTFLRLRRSLFGFGNSMPTRLGRGIIVVGRFAVVQALAQGLGLIAGFILVRALDKPDYALYTLATTGINALVMLSNGGIIDAATAIGGRAWQDARHLGQVVASALSFRKQLATMIVAPVIVFLAWLFVRNGASIGEVLVLSVTAFLAAHFQLSTGILSVVLRLRGMIRELQNLDLIGAALRTALVICLFLVLDAELATTVAAVGAVATYFFARRWVAGTLDYRSEPDSAMLAQIGSVVRRQWLNDLVFIFQGQITLLLLGLFGGSDSVANFGALGRIAALFGIVNAIMQSIVLPRYARCQEPKQWRQLYAAILLGSVGVAAFAVGASLLLPYPLLWILGVKYQDLSYELVLVVLNSSLASIALITWGLNSTRAWIIPAWLNVPVVLASQGLLMAAIGVASMVQMLWIGIAWYGFAALFHVGATFVFSRGLTRV